MSAFLNFLEVHKVGLLTLAALFFALLLALRWVCWIFGLGRFKDGGGVGPGHQEIRFVIADFCVKIIDDFRHLLALIIVFVFLIALIIMLWPGVKKGDVGMMEASLK